MDQDFLGKKDSQQDTNSDLIHTPAGREDVGTSFRRKKKKGLRKKKFFEEEKLNIINGHRLRIGA